MANITFSEVSGLNNSIFGNSQAPIRMLVEKKAESFEQKSVLPLIFSMEKSNHYAEKFTTMTAMDGFVPVGENASHPIDGMQEGFAKTLENVTWKDKFSISREIIEDSQTINFKNKPSAFVTGYYRTRERFGASLLGNAMELSTTATYGGKVFDITTADGDALFSTTHTGKVSGANQSNHFSDAFSADALSAVETSMQNFKGDNGEIMAISPDTIIIPNIYTLKKTVFATIGADKDPATANNGFNYQYGRWNVIVWAELNNYITAGTTPYILLDSTYNQELKGGIWLDRTPLDIRSTLDDDTDANVWYGYSRFTAGFNDWRFAAVGGVAAGDTLVSAS